MILHHLHCSGIGGLYHICPYTSTRVYFNLSYFQPREEYESSSVEFELYAYQGPTIHPNFVWLSTSYSASNSNVSSLPMDRAKNCRKIFDNEVVNVRLTKISSIILIKVDKNRRNNLGRWQKFQRQPNISRIVVKCLNFQQKWVLRSLVLVLGSRRDGKSTRLT